MKKSRILAVNFKVKVLCFQKGSNFVTIMHRILCIILLVFSGLTLSFGQTDSSLEAAMQDFKVGDTVLICKEMTNYLTGEKPSKWVYYVKICYNIIQRDKAHLSAFFDEKCTILSKKTHDSVFVARILYRIY